MKKNAFTLIETIIAIVIFGIGILVVLFGISKTLRNQDYASTQIASSGFSAALVLSFSGWWSFIFCFM